MLEVKPLLVHEWPLLKSLRLMALADAPEAFSTTFAQAQAWTDDEWEGRARRFTADPPAVGYVAYLDGIPCGMISCYLSERGSHAEEPSADLTAVWVDPEMRGQGVGAALAASAADWAAAQGIRVLQAWVTQSNSQAIAFYGKVGFQDTGLRQPCEPDPTGHILLLARQLGR